MGADDHLKSVREGEAAIAVLERDAHELRDQTLGALGFDPDEPVPDFGEGVGRGPRGWSTLLRVSILAMPLMYLNLIYLRFDSDISITLGIDPLGYQFPGFLNSLVPPCGLVGVVLAGFGTAAVVFKRRGRGWVLLVSAFLVAGALWLAAFSTIDWGLVVATALSGFALGAGFTSAASLVMDAYPPGVRVRTVSLWVLGMTLGLVIGNVVVAVGVDTWGLTWRGVLVVLAGVATLVAFASIGLRDPGVGRFDLDRIDEIVRAKVGQRGALAAELSEEDVRIGFGEQVRQVMQTRAASAMLIVFFLFGTALVPFQAFADAFMVARYSWSFEDRAWVFALLALVGVIPLLVLLRRGDAWFRRSPAQLMRVAASLALLGGAATIVVAFWANSVVTIVGLSLAFLGIPIVLAVALVVMLSVVDPRLRPHAAAIAVAAIAGAVLGGGVLAGQLADRYGITTTMVFFGLNFLAVTRAMRIAGRAMSADVSTLADVETQREELRVRVSSGQHFPLLGCRAVDFSYGQLQVLFGVDFTVDDGELVALLGTNGAGKSTLLKLISGIGKPTRGSVHYRGADISYVDPMRRVQFGIAQMPGGRAVFGTMSVAENLRMHGFSLRRSKAAIDRGLEETFNAFPILGERRNQPAATLSGGEQQMLALGKAFILQPRLLLIDELSLGLSPLIVGQLIDLVKRINQSGTAVVVVEQSVNVALTLVDHAYFMERGEMRFDGAAADLIERPDLLRSVFLEGASKGLEEVASEGGEERGMNLDALTHFEVIGPSIALGAITGMTYGIIAVGLILVYRSSRIINFAQGALGVLGAAIAGVAVVEWGLTYWLAFPLALIVSGFAGAASEVVVIRRLNNAPAVIGVVATLGLAEVLLLLSGIVYNTVGAGAEFPSPDGLPDFDLGPLRVTTAYSAMMIFTPLIVIGLVVFFRRGWFGLAMRASAVNVEAAELEGVNARGMATLAWGISGALAAYTAILILPNRGFTGADFLGPELLLRALTAAVIARMTSLSVAMIAGIGVGVIESVLLWNYPDGSLVETVLFGIILVALLLQRARYDRRDAKGTWTAIRGWLPLPESYRRIFVIRNMRWFVFVVMLGIGLALPLVITNANVVSFTVIEVMTIVGFSVAVVAGLSGQLSLGQFALAGVGGVVSYKITDLTGTFVLGFVAGGVAAAAVALLIGLPALRIRGPMLAVTTLGFAIVTSVWALQQPWMIGSGVSQSPPSVFGYEIDSARGYYLLGFAVFLVALFFARNVWKSGLGLRMRAVRDNEDTARAFSVNATVVKLQAFGIAGFLAAGLAGAVYGGSLSLLTSDAFSVQRSIDAAAVAVLGGLGIVMGPLFGALFIVGIPEIPNIFNIAPLDQLQSLATVLGWLVIVTLVPGGIAVGIGDLRKLIFDAIASRRGLDPEKEWDADAMDASPPRPNIALPRSAPSGIEAGEVVLRTAAISRAYGGLRAVDDVSVEVRAGETLGLIGPNGAGKTTLFELMSGFVRPSSGTVEFLGADVTEKSPSARGELGLIRSFQDAALFPTLTVLDCVQLAMERNDRTHFVRSFLGSGAQTRRKEERAKELVAMMGLSRWRDKPTAELSTGTRRVVELACMIALDPVVLLLDEPSSGMAQRETEMLGEIITPLKQQLDLTIVLIEHDIPLVMGLSNRVVAMEAGRVIADGPPEAVRENPRVVESYLGGDIAAISRSSVRVTP